MHALAYKDRPRPAFCRTARLCAFCAYARTYAHAPASRPPLDRRGHWIGPAAPLRQSDCQPPDPAVNWIARALPLQSDCREAILWPAGSAGLLPANPIAGHAIPRLAGSPTALPLGNPIAAFGLLDRQEAPPRPPLTGTNPAHWAALPQQPASIPAPSSPHQHPSVKSGALVRPSQPALHHLHLQRPLLPALPIHASIIHTPSQFHRPSPPLPPIAHPPAPPLLSPPPAGIGIALYPPAFPTQRLEIRQSGTMPTSRQHGPLATLRAGIRCANYRPSSGHPSRPCSPPVQDTTSCATAPPRIKNGITHLSIPPSSRQHHIARQSIIPSLPLLSRQPPATHPSPPTRHTQRTPQLHAGFSPVPRHPSPVPAPSYDSREKHRIPPPASVVSLLSRRIIHLTALALPLSASVPPASRGIGIIHRAASSHPPRWQQMSGIALANYPPSHRVLIPSPHRATAPASRASIRIPPVPSRIHRGSPRQPSHIIAPPPLQPAIQRPSPRVRPLDAGFSPAHQPLPRPPLGDQMTGFSWANKKEGVAVGRGRPPLFRHPLSRGGCYSAWTSISLTSWKNSSPMVLRSFTTTVFSLP